jgi:hypothetical protein
MGKGSTWPALFAIPAVLVGNVAAIYLILLGIKGIRQVLRGAAACGRVAVPPSNRAQPTRQRV